MPPRTPTLNQRIAEQATLAVAWVRDVSMFVKLVLVAGGAFVAGLARVLPLPTTPVDVTDTAQGAGLAAVFVGGAALAFLDKNLAGSLKVAADAAAELQGIQTTAAELADSLAQALVRDRQLRALRSASAAVLERLGQCLSRSRLDETAMMSELLDVGLEELLVALGLVMGDTWTISIYRAELGSRSALCRLATRRSNRIEEDRPSREWLPGEGHIGMTYLRADETILEDVAEPAVHHAMYTPAYKQLASDAARYRSIAAVPIIRDGATAVWGVLIATSSRPSQFSSHAFSEGFERAEAVRFIAGLLALAATIHHILTVPPVRHGAPIL